MRPNLVIRVLAVTVALVSEVPRFRAILADAQRCGEVSVEVGAKDQLGSGNLIEAEMALRAAKLIHTGEFPTRFDLSADLPLIGSRRFDLHMKRGTATAPGTRAKMKRL